MKSVTDDIKPSVDAIRHAKCDEYRKARYVFTIASKKHKNWLKKTKRGKCVFSNWESTYQCWTRHKSWLTVTPFGVYQKNV